MPIESQRFNPEDFLAFVGRIDWRNISLEVKQAEPFAVTLGFLDELQVDSLEGVLFVSRKKSNTGDCAEMNMPVFPPLVLQKKGKGIAPVIFCA